ncbi:hypothetical protein V1525DRAFT_407946 [Lipomyces kononenkoae]|uniref:Uncharacterized protein n=1 Tax=Lipomyces kononenkoae TaxID=34357 RepID=A0ACC3SX05_LIPKO
MKHLGYSRLIRRESLEQTTAWIRNRSLWNTVVRDDPSKARNWVHFISWTRNLIMGNANFDAGIYDLHDQARQRPGQMGTEFVTGLAAMETGRMTRAAGRARSGTGSGRSSTTR